MAGSSAQKADLVLEGGGVKGIAHVGAISVLEERGWTFNRVAGTSAGAIVAALVAAGFSSTEMEAEMRAVDYTRFRDLGIVDRIPAVGKALSLVFEQGVYEGNHLKHWLGELLATKEVHTFADLRFPDPGASLSPEDQYRLVTITADITQGSLRRLPWDYDTYDVVVDETAVADAVRASASIPFVFEPVKLPGADGMEHWLVDGGMLSNYPVDAFDRTDGQPPRWPTFGIKLSGRPSSNQIAATPVKGTVDMARAMIATATGFYDLLHVDDPAATVRTIFVDTTGVRATDFGIDAATTEQLFQNGREAASKFLDGGGNRPAWDWNTYLQTYRS